MNALNSLEIALEINPQLTISLVEMSSIYLDQYEFQDAIVYAKKALEIEPDNEDALTNLGSCYFNLKSYDKAIKVLKKVLSLNPNANFAQKILKLAIKEGEK